MPAQPQLPEAPKVIRTGAATAWRDSLGARARALAEEYAVPQQRLRTAEGSVPEALARFAEQVKADIVVMGAASRPRMGRLLIGHTAERVLDAHKCDVLVVKGPGIPRFQRAPVHPSCR